jgi:hypothetical protein
MLFRTTPAEKTIREQQNFVGAAEAVNTLQSERLDRTINQLERIFDKEREFMRGVNHAHR